MLGTVGIPSMVTPKKQAGGGADKTAPYPAARTWHIVHVFSAPVRVRRDYESNAPLHTLLGNVNATS